MSTEKVDLSAAEFDGGFREAIEAAIKHGAGDSAYCSAVRKKEKLADGQILLDLVACDGATCVLGKYCVKPDGAVEDGWPGDVVPPTVSTTKGIAGATLETKAGTQVQADTVLAGKVVALFFSAEWCPGCQVFTPILSKAYTAAKAAGKNIEIVFVSSDVDAAAQIKYMDEHHGDWLRVPYDSPLRQGLKQQYGSFAGKEAAGFAGVKRREGIPNLVVIGPSGEEHVFEEGEGSVAIETKGAEAFDAWAVYAWPKERKRSVGETL